MLIELETLRLVNMIKYLQYVQDKIHIVSYQVVTEPCCGLSVIFCGFISDLIGRETINIQEIFSGVHGFMGKTVKPF